MVPRSKHLYLGGISTKNLKQIKLTGQLQIWKELNYKVQYEFSCLNTVVSRSHFNLTISKIITGGVKAWSSSGRL